MKRNQDRIWYDEGYSDGSKSRREQGIIPRVIGVTCLTALLIADQYWILAFVILWAGFEILEWWDLQKWHESDPPEVWE